MFSIRSEKLGPLDTLKLLNEDTGEYATIIPGFGATLNELVLKKEGLHSLIDGSYNYEELLTEGKVKFKGPKLFPFPNRTKDGYFSFEGKNYQLRKNFVSQGHAIHGLLLESSFKIIGQTKEKDSASVKLEYTSDGKEAAYPFSYKLFIDYTLSATEGFSCKTTVVSHSNSNMPLGDGWHPYFKMDMPIDHLQMRLPSCCRLELDGKSIPTGKIFNEDRFRSFEPIGNKKFDDCFRIDNNESITGILLRNKVKDIEMTVWLENGKDKYNFFQLYTPPHRKSIAIEPMTCAPDALNNKLGLIILKPDQEINFSYGVKLNHCHN